MLLNILIMPSIPQRKLIQIIPTAVWSMLVAARRLLPLPVIIKINKSLAIMLIPLITKMVYGLIMNTMGTAMAMYTFIQTVVNISLIR